MSRALPHWNPGTFESQQLAALIANMIESHCRAAATCKLRCYEDCAEENRHDNQTVT